MIGKNSGSHAGPDDNAPAHATISDLYPEVRRLTLFIAFQEADAESEPNYQQIIFTADTEAVFRLDCSRDHCAGGGFDLTPLVDEMMKNHESMAHGKLSCEGTLGSGGERCELQAEYRIIVD